MNRLLAAVPSEIGHGWPIIVGCAIGVGTGVTLMFLNFSMFVIPLSEELHVTRGELGGVQALIATIALGSPLLGRLADIYGVKPVFVICTLLVAAVNIAAGLFVSSLFHMGLTLASLGLLGAGTSSVVLSRPINSHFPQRRGTALGLMAAGISVLTIMAPPAINWVMESWGWQGAFIGMAAVSIVAGIPAVILLVPDDGRARSRIGIAAGTSPSSGRQFLRSRDFWLLVMALIMMSLATAGANSQLVPMVRDEGLDASTAALALSFFAVGMFIGRLVGGWLLDRFNPGNVAFLLTFMPAFGFFLLLVAPNMASTIILAVTLIGVQQGAEIDIAAYFVGRRFAREQYSAIYGTLLGLGWIGNIGGLLGMSKAHDIMGNYALAQAIAIGCLVVAAILIRFVSLPPLEVNRGK